MLYLKISIFGAALTLLWTSLHTIVVPARLLDFVSELQKNTFLGILTFIGLVLAMLVQPVAGAMSDRSTSRFGPRRPYILIGTMLAFMVLPGLGFSPTFIAFLATYCLLQIFSNIAQGAFQGFIPDLVSREKRGVASGVKSLIETLGTVALLRAIAYFMDHYLTEGEIRWMWLTLGFLAVVLAAALLATLLVVKESPRSAPRSSPLRALSYRTFWIDLKAVPAFPWFLLSRLFMVMAIGTLQTYAFYLLQDVVQVANPAAAAGDLLIVVGGSLLLAVYPAGRLSDRIGRKPVLVFAGLLGAGSILVLFFAHSYNQVLIFGSLLGIAIGTFMSVNWALATDIVPQGEEARYLGLTNFATAGAAALARLVGPVVDFFNSREFGQGYSVLLAACITYFLLGSVFVLKIREPRSLKMQPG
jgi:MFS family permease